MSELRRRQRWLFLDPKLDLYTEESIVSSAQYDAMIALGFVDVTDDPVHEQLFKLYQAQK